MKKFVLYRRLSKDDPTKVQHGFESQKMDLDFFLESAEDYEVIGSFKEFISGAADVKPELEKALTLCREQGAVLLISKLDRLSRRVSQIANYMEGDVQFKVTTYPSASNMMLQIMSVMSEEERRVISERQKRTMALIKRDFPEKLAKGEGSKWQKSYQENRAKGLHKKRSTSIAAAQHKAPVIAAIKRMIDYSENSLKLSEISENLTKEGFTTPRGKVYSEAAVSRLMKENKIPYTKKSFK